MQQVKVCDLVKATILRVTYKFMNRGLYILKSLIFLQDQQLFEAMIIWTALNMQLFTHASWKISMKLTVHHTMTLTISLYIYCY
jgi:hypothetical protein